MDKNIITSGEKRYIGVRNFSDIIAAANRKIPNVNFDVNLINHAVVSLDYTAVSGASNNITLNLNHVGYNTNVRGAYFRYEQCGYTYVDLMTMSAKMGMQAYIYSDAEYQAYKDSIYEFYTGLNEKGYMVASATQVALGNYSESDITMLGTIGQIGAGLLGADLPADLRDLVYDLQHWNELVKNNPGQIALDTVGVLPLIGVIKYGDEAALVIKKADGTIEKVITSKKLPQQAGRGQSKGGRHEPLNLKEQLAMEEVLTNPSKGIVLVGKNTDPRWPAEEGWVKKTQNVNGYEIHYEYNPRTGEVDDVKFK